MKRPLIGALLALSLTLPATPAAQQQDEMISKALVERLVAAHMGDHARIIEGRAPSQFPSELVPEGAAVRASLVLAPMFVVLAEAAEFTDASRRRLERQMAAAGWVAGRSPGYSRGLTLSRVEGARTFCDDGRYATYDTYRREGGGAWLRLTVMTRQRGLCGDDGGDMPLLFEALDVPAMEPPPGSTVAGGMGGGGSENWWDQTLRLTTELNARQAADYYAGQLTLHKWLLESRADADGLSVVRLALRSPMEAVATIQTTRAPGGEIQVDFRVLSGDRRRR